MRRPTSRGVSSVEYLHVVHSAGSLMKGYREAKVAHKGVQLAILRSAQNEIQFEHIYDPKSNTREH